jgi:hypothetical protein
LLHHSASGSSIDQQLQGTSHDVSIAAAAAMASSSSHPTSLARPQLKSLQRVSNDSIGSPQSGDSSRSGGSTASAYSEGGEHLAEARENLLYSSGSGSGTGSGETSRRQSTSTERPSKAELFEMNVLTPTPPSQPVEAGQPEAGPSRPRRDVSPSPETADGERHELPPEHAWDSVVSFFLHLALAR